MKKISLLEIVVVMIVTLAVMFMCADTYAADEDYNDLGNFVINGNNTNNSTNTNKNTNTSTNTNTNTNKNTNTNNTNTNTNKNTNSSSYTNTNTNTLPKTGIESSQSVMLLVAGIATVSAVFAYKKMRDYRDL